MRGTPCESVCVRERGEGERGEGEREGRRRDTLRERVILLERERGGLREVICIYKRVTGRERR